MGDGVGLSPEKQYALYDYEHAENIGRLHRINLLMVVLYWVITKGDIYGEKDSTFILSHYYLIT